MPGVVEYLMPLLNDDFPIAFQVFAPKLMKTEDEVFIHLLRLDHGDKKLTEKQWYALLAKVKGS